jgi:hypothetical protein
MAMRNSLEDGKILPPFFMHRNALSDFLALETIAVEIVGAVMILLGALRLCPLRELRLR